MMARKLSRIEWRGACCLLAALSSWPAQTLFAEDGIQVSTPTNTFDNPFVKPAPTASPKPRIVAEEPPRTVAEEPQVARRLPTTYQNPFANMAKTPPVDSFSRPGPVSRWQRPDVPDSDKSLIKSAMSFPLPIAPLTPRPAWDQLPPSETLRRQASERDTPTDPTFYNNLVDSKDVVRFSPTPLAQPNELAPADSGDATFSMGPARTGRSVAASEKLDATAPKPALMTTAFDVDLTSPKNEAPSAAIEQPAMQAQEVPSAEIVAECSDTPAGWLEQAHAAAKNAASEEELTNVIKLCERGLKQNPSPDMLKPLKHLAAWTHNERGELHADSQRIDEALQDFNAAIALDPDCSQALHNRGVTLAQRNQFAAALRDFNRVIELNPGVGIACRNRAELLSALDRMEEAIADYCEAIDTLPEDASLLRARAHAYQRIGDFTLAARDIARAIQLEPDAPEAYIERGNLQAEQSHFVEAAESFQRAIEIDGSNADAHRSLAWLHATCSDRRYRNPQRALELATTAARLSSPDDYLILDTMAAAKACAGQFEEAVELEKKALNAAPAAVTTSLQQRLALYQNGQAYVTPGTPKPAVQPASHEAPVTTAISKPAARAATAPSVKSQPMK
jgi:tetratricopeptide (TPR) repeat protein